MATKTNQTHVIIWLLRQIKHTSPLQLKTNETHVIIWLLRQTKHTSPWKLKQTEHASTRNLRQTREPLKAKDKRVISFELRDKEHGRP